MPSDFGRRLRELRREKGYGQKQVADWIGVSDSSIRKYETGVRTPDPDALITIASHFNVSVDYLLGISDSIGQSAIGITYEEQKLLKLYRAISDDDKEMIEGMLRLAYERSSRKEGAGSA